MVIFHFLWEGKKKKKQSMLPLKMNSPIVTGQITLPHLRISTGKYWDRYCLSPMPEKTITCK